MVNETLPARYMLSGVEIQMNPVNKRILERTKYLEEAITKAREYLENGTHSYWHKFRPLFGDKVRDGKGLPPHKDWVRNVFLPSLEKKLNEAERLLERLSQSKRLRG